MLLVYSIAYVAIHYYTMYIKFTMYTGTIFCVHDDRIARLQTECSANKCPEITTTMPQSVCVYFSAHAMCTSVCMCVCVDKAVRLIFAGAICLAWTAKWTNQKLWKTFRALISRCVCDFFLACVSRCFAYEMRPHFCVRALKPSYSGICWIRTRVWVFVERAPSRWLCAWFFAYSYGFYSDFIVWLFSSSPLRGR